MDLEKIRTKIDLTDNRIMKLLNERMEYVLRLKKLKSKITDPDREKKVLHNIEKQAGRIMDREFSEKIFKEVIQESKKVQSQDLNLIAFQGEHGAYSEYAAHSYNQSLVPIPCMEFAEVFESVSKSHMDYGIVPVENSLGGGVSQVNDLLVETDLKIVGEIKLPVRHSLLALPDTDYRDIRVVYSHPQALSQCRGFISRNKLEARPFYDTAGAARMLSQEQLKSAAVIASNICAELYNLDVIKENIEDHPSNFTRFVVLAREPLKSGGNKCSVVFSVQHKAGALFSILKIFADANVNLTRIESRPARSDPSNYAFLLDFQGSEHDKKIMGVLEKLKKEAKTFKFLGCYMEGVL